MQLEFNTTNNTITIKGVDAHRINHIFNALMYLAPESSCVLDLYNELARAYTRMVPEIPDEVIAPIDVRAEKEIRETQLAIFLGLEPVYDDDETSGL